MTLANKLPLLPSWLATMPEKNLPVVAQSTSSANYQILHKIMGRWRIKIARIFQDENFTSKLQYLLEKNSYIFSARYNLSASCLVIDYDSSQIAGDQLENLIENTLTKTDWDAVSLVALPAETSMPRVF